MKLTDQRFSELIEQAVAGLPEAFRRHMVNVTIEVQPLPNKRTCREMELDSPYELLGLYHGTPLTERSVEAPPALPDAIVIYQRAIEAVCDDEAEVVEQIRQTVLHEIGHFFGLDEDDLERLGYR